MSREDTETVVRLENPGQRPTSPVVMMGQLLKLSNLVTRPFFVFLAGPFSLNHNELRVLMTLASMREAAAHEVAKAAGMHPMNVSRAVASLTRAGRISARRDVDGRRKILALTSEGLELHKALIPHVRRVAEVMSDSMSSLEAEFFAKLLAKLVERLDSLALTDPMLIDAAALTQATGRQSPTIRAVPPTKSSLESPQIGARKRRSSTTNTRKSRTSKGTKTESRRKMSK